MKYGLNLLRIKTLRVISVVGMKNTMDMANPKTLQY